MQLHLGGALHALALPFAKLAFWRKPAADSAEAPAPDASHVPDAEESSTEIPVPKPGLWARLKTLFRRSPAQAEDAAAPETLDAAPGEPSENTESDEATPPARPSLLARFKLLFRRKAAPAEGEDAEPQASEAAPTEDEDEAPAPRGLLQKLRSKWVWIPALALLLLGVIGTVAAVLVRSANETQRLQQELQAAKRKLQQQATPAAVAVAPPAAPAKPAPPPEPKRDPAFDIVGVKPAPEAESGLNAGDCVVSDREQVAANLKRCIDSFNAALSTSNKKSKP